MVVLDETYPIMDFLHNSCRFFAHESCGQCTPCREGTHWALEMLERIKAGRGRLRDLDLLLEIGEGIGIIPGTTICGLADGAAWPIKTALGKFRGELEDYIRQTNPQGCLATEPAEALPAAQPSGNHPCATRPTIDGRFQLSRAVGRDNPLWALRPPPAACGSLLAIFVVWAVLAVVHALVRRAYPSPFDSGWFPISQFWGPTVHVAGLPYAALFLAVLFYALRQVDKLGAWSLWAGRTGPDRPGQSGARGLPRRTDRALGRLRKPILQRRGQDHFLDPVAARFQRQSARLVDPQPDASAAGRAGPLSVSQRSPAAARPPWPGR